MNYCINLKKRKGKPFCKLLNKEITLSQCQECVNKKYKKCTKVVQNTSFKKRNAQKIKNTVQKIKKQTYKHKKADKNRFSIITNDLEHCIICGNKKDNIHEVFYGSYRHVSIKYGMIIPLCLKHHTEGIYSVHYNRELDLKFKKLAQKIFEEKYSHDLFMKEFKIDYIEKYKED